jgi:hypothetical protein
MGVAILIVHGPGEPRQIGRLSSLRGDDAELDVEPRRPCELDGLAPWRDLDRLELGDERARAVAPALVRADHIGRIR